MSPHGDDASPHRTALPRTLDADGANARDLAGTAPYFLPHLRALPERAGQREGQPAGPDGPRDVAGIRATPANSSTSAG